MRKLTIGLSLLLLLVAVPLSISRLKNRVEYQGSAASSDTASLSFSPNSRSMAPNQEGTLNVVVAIDTTGTVQSGGIQLVIDYDTSRIQIVDQDTGQDGIQIQTSNLYGLTITNQVNESLGRIFFMAGALDSGLQPKPVTVGGVVATIHFRTKSLAGRASFNFKFSGVGAIPCDAYRCTGSGCDQCDGDVFLYQSENEDILGRVSDGYIDIAYPATSTLTPTNTPLPTNTPTNTPTVRPSNTPTNTPTITPTARPTNTPTNTPTATVRPTNTPTNTPRPTNTPTITPTARPTNTPTIPPQCTPGQTQCCDSQRIRTCSSLRQWGSCQYCSSGQVCFNDSCVLPTPTPTNTPRPTNTPTNTPMPTNTLRPTSTNTPTPRLTATNTPRPTNTSTPRPTSTPTIRPTSTPRPTNTPLPTNTPTSGQGLTGDLNGDGRVDIVDLVLVGANFGGSGPAGDVNKDGVVNVVDLVLVGANFGRSI